MDPIRARRAPAAVAAPLAALAMAGVLAASAGCSSPRARDAEVVEASSPRRYPMVYRNGPGSWVYHRRDCPLLGPDPLELPLDAAVRHLEPCPRCEPDH